MSSLAECITWVTIGFAESVAIVTLNLCIIIAFIKNRNLRKRSTYLLINLAVIDMLTGASAVYDFHRVGAECNLWKSHSVEGWAGHVLVLFLLLFPISSLSNITVIALERMHATFCPLRHRALKKSAYGINITIVWVTAGLAATAHVPHFGQFSNVYVYSRMSLAVMFLLIIFVSYVSIVIKVRYGAHPQHHGAASRERKLTMTLLIVTVVSPLLYLPFVMLFFIISIGKSKILQSLSYAESFHLFNAIVALFYANHFINPILYAIRMPEYRSALLALFRKRSQQQRRALDLRDM